MTRRRHRAARLLGACAVTILVATGCSPYYLNESSDPIVEADVVGTWVSDDDEGHVSSLVFSADGTVIVEGLPENPTADHMDVDWEGPMFTGTATWSISETDVSSWHVDLNLIGGSSPSLLAITTDDELRLVLPLGDPDMKTRVTFVRQE